MEINVHNSWMQPFNLTFPFSILSINNFLIEINFYFITYIEIISHNNMYHDREFYPYHKPLNVLKEETFYVLYVLPG